MNQTDHPLLAANDAVAGFVFQTQEAREATEVDRKALESSCVDLISKLENLFAKAKELPSDEYVDDSAKVGRKMLEQLLRFCEQFLTGEAAGQAKKEINRAITISHAYDEVLKTRSLKNTILRVFCEIEESEDIQASHTQLGEALIRACAATLYHAIMLVGFDTPLGKQIDQSTVVFVNELKGSW